MKKISLLLLLVVSFSLVLSGCIITDDGDDYERKEFKSKETFNQIIVSAESADVLFQYSDDKEVSVKYPESSTKQVYDISVSNGVLEIKNKKYREC